jgi:hypothetical protein
MEARKPRMSVPITSLIQLTTLAVLLGTRDALQALSIVFFAEWLGSANNWDSDQGLHSVECHYGIHN